MRYVRPALILNDLDGCFGDFTKPSSYPHRQDLSQHGNLSLIKIATQLAPDVKFAACTGRSYHLAQDIMKLSGLNALSIVEMGSEIVTPDGERYRTIDHHNPKDAYVADQLEEWVRNFAPIEAELQAYFPKAEITWLRDNVHMLTVEMRGDAGIPSTDVADYLIHRHIPLQMWKHLENHTIVTQPSRRAVDIRMYVNKGHGVDHVLEKLAVPAERTLGIGDSYHSDILMMQRCGMVACVANADDKLKEYVSEREGFISESPYLNGVLEIYAHFLDN